MKDLGEIRAANHPPRKWIFKSLLVEGTVNILYGPPDTGKSWFALRLIERWITQEKFLWYGPSPTSGKKAIYYALEDDERQFKEDRAAFLSYDLDGVLKISHDLSLDSLADVSGLKKAILDCNAGIVVVDNLLSVRIGNRELNENRDMKLFMESLRRVAQETGACIVVVHHTGKFSSRAMASGIDESDADTTAPLGATALFALAYTRIYLSTKSGSQMRVRIRGKGIPRHYDYAVFEDRDWRLSNKDPAKLDVNDIDSERGIGLQTWRGRPTP